MKRFAAWRFHCADIRWHEHVSECIICDFDQPCLLEDRYRRRRDFWRKWVRA